MDMDKEVKKESVSKEDLKTAMPLAAEWVAERRREWGDKHVTAMLKGAMRGQRNCCYLVERSAPDAYRTFGAPFDWDEADSKLIGECLAFGLQFAGMMRPPGAVHGAH